MKEQIKKIILLLEKQSNTILNSWHDDRTLTEVFGWNFPYVTRFDLASLPTSLAKKLSFIQIESIDTKLLQNIESKINGANTHIQYFFNGHGDKAIPAYIATIECIKQQLNPLFNLETLTDTTILPNRIAKKLRSIQAELNEIIPQKDDLLKQINIINNATEAAENLPVDLESLKLARDKSKNTIDELENFSAKCKELFEKSTGLTEKIEIQKNEAEKLINRCEEAYRITTTKGLAAAFDQRATRLSRSMWTWVLGLIISLSSAVFLGSKNFDSLKNIFENPNAESFLQLTVSFISLGAPIWFSWLATKQIGQRFKLAEDYAFKASVAKAYEGYRKEAARINEKLEAQLFESILTRLDEPPLRLVESSLHGSPWHEFLSSVDFQSALKNIPDLQEYLFNFLKNSKSITHKATQEILTKNPKSG
ncbi:hypothetical protein [Leptospira idonii]|uniref:Uncharacterized protein n=1 Tax=Leptospira idonii TaxID=1193500 RepID=A0A4R9LX63_9LEPT|nr:hypothetical protein [Leptospira idonii]TGN18850.1 hypothetical protein EHS15_11795 [Leptospira idonii]